MNDCRPQFSARSIYILCATGCLFAVVVRFATQDVRLAAAADMVEEEKTAPTSVRVMPFENPEIWVHLTGQARLDQGRIAWVKAQLSAEIDEAAWEAHQRQRAERPAPEDARVSIPEVPYDDAARYIHLTGNPETDRAEVERVKELLTQKYKDRQFAISEAYRLKRLADMARWHGTEISVPSITKEGQVNEEELARRRQAAQLFAENYSGTPKQRYKLFADYFEGRGSFGAKCVGWKAQLFSAVPKGDGWEVQLAFEPKLIAEHHKLVHLGLVTFETWFVSADGQTTKLLKLETRGLLIPASL